VTVCSRKTHTKTAHKNAYHCPFQILEPKTHIHTHTEEQQQHNEHFLVLNFFCFVRRGYTKHKKKENMDIYSYKKRKRRKVQTGI